MITCEPTFYSRNRRKHGEARARRSHLRREERARRQQATRRRFGCATTGASVRRTRWRRRWATRSAGRGTDRATTRRATRFPPSRSTRWRATRRRALNARGGIRVIGDPQTSVRTIGLLPGSTPIAASLDALPGADAVIAGEVREWESAEYARDLVAAGGRKGLILVGRLVSEEPGHARMRRLAEDVVPEVPVRHVAAGDPYWRPA